MRRQIVFGDRYVETELPDQTTVVSPGVSLPLEPAGDLTEVVRGALNAPLDRPPLRAQVKPGDQVTIAFDDATVPCYAPLWPAALGAIIEELENAGVARRDIHLVCANALHRQFTHEELARLIGDDLVREHRDRLTCHDAEDDTNMVHLGVTASGLDVELNRCVTDSDLLVYLNCSTMRGFSGGWKSVCVGLSGYRSIRHHHTPDTMSMSLDRNRMHEMLDEMGEVVDNALGAERVFKLETILANPLQVHEMVSGSVWATRRHVVEKLKRHQGPRRELVEEPVDVVVYGVPEWSPYAAFSHMNPILDLISTGLGYLGGMIEAIGKPGCTVVLATPCRFRWDERHHPSYREVWETVLPETRDPDDARAHYEPEFAARADYIEKYRHEYGFHPVHGIMALYPLKRLRHAREVIVAGAEDPAVPRHCGFDHAPDIQAALEMAAADVGPDMTVGLVEYPQAFNRQ